MERRSDFRPSRSAGPSDRSAAPVVAAAAVALATVVLAGLALAAPSVSVTPAEPDPSLVEPSLPDPAERTASFWAAARPADPAIDVRFSSLELPRAVRFLAGEGTNVLLSGVDVDRRVTMDLQSVPTGTALDWLLRTEGLAARFEGNTVLLSSRERRSYPVPLVVQEASGLWDELETGLAGLRSQEATFALHRAGGVLTIEDSPANLDQVESHLLRVISSLLRQVEIEVKILELVWDDQRTIGVDWTAFEGILDPDWGLRGGTPFGVPGFSSPTDQREIFQVGLLKPGKWQAFLDAFEEDIQLDVVSRPRITAMSNQPAEFRVKERIPYLTKTVSQEGGVPLTEFELQFDEAGIDLEVTASVGDDGVVTMDVHPSVSSVVGFTQSLPDLGPQPIIDQRETRSTVRLPERHSLVMGGLMQDRENVSVSGVPGLMRVPWLGRLFRSDQVRKEKTEIVIVLTPRLRQEQGVRSLEAHDRILSAEIAPGDDEVPTGLAAARTDRAWERMVAGDAAGAIGGAEAAWRVRPAAWWTLNNLGLAWREAGFLAKAEESLRRAVRSTDPAPPIALANLGTLMLHRGRADEAAPLLEEAAARAPYGPVRDEALLGWALALEVAGRRSEALAALEEAGGPEGRLGARVRPRVERILAGLEQASAGP